MRVVASSVQVRVRRILEEEQRRDRSDRRGRVVCKGALSEDEWWLEPATLVVDQSCSAESLCRIKSNVLM